MKEQQIQRQILDFLATQKHTIYAWKVDNGAIFDPRYNRFRRSNSRYQLRGVSDILGLVSLSDGHTGRLLALEVKSKTGRLSQHQKEFLSSIAKKGGIAAMVRSVNDTIQILKEFKVPLRGV